MRRKLIFPFFIVTIITIGGAILKKASADSLGSFSESYIQSSKNEKESKILNLLQLSSSAPVVLTVKHSGDTFEQTGSENSAITVTDEVQEEVHESLLTLARRHQAFLGLFLLEVSAGRWMTFAIDSHESMHGMEVTNRHGELMRSLLVFAEDHLRNVNGRHVLFYSLLKPMFTSCETMVNGKPLKLKGYVYAMMEELMKRLRIRWKCSNHVQWRMQAEKENKMFLRDIYKDLPKTIAQGEADISVLNMMYENEERLEPIAATFQFRYAFVVVPYCRPEPTWSYLLRSFGLDLWGLLLATVLTYALAWRVVAGESLAASAAAALRAFSSCGGAPQDRVRATPQRLQLAAALLASAVVIISLYQGRIFAISYSANYPEIKNMDDLGRSKLPSVKSDPENHINNNNNNNILERLKRQESFAWHLTDGSWEQLAHTIRLSDVMHPVHEYGGHVLTTMHSRKNFPWVNAINLKILEFDAAGLQTKWKDDHYRTYSYYYRNAEANYPKFEVPRADGCCKPHFQALRDVRLHFAVLATGLVLAFVLFCTELRQALALRRRSASC